MGKLSILSLAAAAVFSGAIVEAADDFKALQNPGDKTCIITSKFNAAVDQFALTTGSCTSDKTVEFRYKNKVLKSSDGYCLGTATPSVQAGTKLILDECLPKAKGQIWTRVGVNQWRNDFGLCMEKVGSALVQSPCATLPSNDKTSKQQWVFFAPAPPAPPEIWCNEWNRVYNCPANTDPVNNIKCVGANDYTCNQVCCRKQPQYTCGSVGFQCPRDYVLDQPQRCGNYGYPPCDFKRCCKPAPPPVTTCSRWNRCNGGYMLKNNANRIQCALGLGASAPLCTNDLCCTPRSYYCSDYFADGNRCRSGFEPISDARVIKCDLSIPGDCNSMCCIQSLPPAAATCADWYADGNRCNQRGFALVDNPERVKASNQDKCCEPDTCRKWLNDPERDGYGWCAARNRTPIGENPPSVNCWDPNTEDRGYENRGYENLVPCDGSQCCPN